MERFDDLLVKQMVPFFVPTHSLHVKFHEQGFRADGAHLNSTAASSSCNGLIFTSGVAHVLDTLCRNGESNPDHHDAWSSMSRFV